MQSRAAPQFQGSRTIDSSCHRDQAADETCCARGPPSGRDPYKVLQTETTAGTGPGRTLATDPEFPHSFSRPRSARQRRSGKSSRGGCPTSGRGRTLFLDPPGPRPAFGRPRSPERDCESGRQSRHWWAQIEMGHGRPGLVHGWLFRQSHGPEPRRSEWTRMNHISRIGMFAGTG